MNKCIKPYFVCGFVILGQSMLYTCDTQEVSGKVHLEILKETGRMNE
jgi:hypothetical protein